MFPYSDSDNLDYKNYLGVELHKNKHKIVEWEKITKTETYEIKSLESLGWKIFNQYEEQTGAMSNYREEHQQQRPRTIHDDKDSDVSGWFSHSKVSNKEGEFDEETTKLGEKDNYTALTLRASQGKPNSGRGEDNLLEGQRQDTLQVKERFHMLHKSRQLELGMLEGGSSKTLAGVVMENGEFLQKRPPLILRINRFSSCEKTAGAIRYLRRSTFFLYLYV